MNLWCALPGGSGEPERVTELASLPVLAKVYVKPASVSIIAVVHNGDLAHGLMMEVADVAVSRPTGGSPTTTRVPWTSLRDRACFQEVAECVKRELRIDGFENVAVTSRDTDGNAGQFSMEEWPDFPCKNPDLLSGILISY